LPLHPRTHNGLLPALAIIECPHREIGGKLTSYEDLVEIREYCKDKRIHLHLDGARLWEASAYYPQLSILTYLFDTVYVSFYKGLGGLTGAMLLGNLEFIEESRNWLRRFGGNLYSLLPYYLSAWKGFRENQGTFQLRQNYLQQVIENIEKALQIDAKQRGHPSTIYIRFDPASIPTVSLIHTSTCLSSYFTHLFVNCATDCRIDYRRKTYSIS
jgi:threonine aldolase